MSIVAHAPPSATLTALLLEVSRAEFNERSHQKVCRALRADSECASCLSLEAAWMAADRALSAFLDEVV